MVEFVLKSTMGLNIKNSKVEELANLVSKATGESKTEAILVALEERRQRLGLSTVEERVARLGALLAQIHQGRTYPPMTKEEWDEINEVD